jgi:2-haloacid dehalogenase
MVRAGTPSAAPPAPRLAGIRACVFDAYGTLFDVASACARLDSVLEGRAQALAGLWRDKQLQYTWLRTIQGRHADFEAVTREALQHAMEALAIPARLEARLMQGFDALDLYPEVPAVLARLRAAGYPTAVLSNGSPRMLAALLAHAGIAQLFDAVVSVETVGVFKPHPRVYQSVVDVLGVSAGAICFQSSNGWDAYGASAFGMKVVWCNRRAQVAERLPGAPDAQVATLAELPDLLGMRSP